MLNRKQQIQQLCVAGGSMLGSVLYALIGWPGLCFTMSAICLSQAAIGLAFWAPDAPRAKAAADDGGAAPSALDHVFDRYIFPLLFYTFTSSLTASTFIGILPFSLQARDHRSRVHNVYSLSLVVSGVVSSGAVHKQRRACGSGVKKGASRAAGPLRLLGRRVVALHRRVQRAHVRVLSVLAVGQPPVLRGGRSGRASVRAPRVLPVCRGACHPEIRERVPRTNDRLAKR